MRTVMPINSRHLFLAEMHSSGLQISLKIIAGWMLYIRMTYAWLILNISPGKQKNVLLRFDTIYRRDRHMITASTDWPLTKRVTSQWHHIPGIWLAEGEAAGWLTCDPPRRSAGPLGCYLSLPSVSRMRHGREPANLSRPADWSDSFDLINI